MVHNSQHKYHTLRVILGDQLNAESERKIKFMPTTLLPELGPWLVCAMAVFLGTLVQRLSGAGYGMFAAPVMALVAPEWLPGTVVLVGFLIGAGSLLNARDAVLRTGNFEVHVTEVIFVTHDVSKKRELVTLFYQADRDTRCWLLDWNTGIHECERSTTDTGHRATSV